MKHFCLTHAEEISVLIHLAIRSAHSAKRIAVRDAIMNAKSIWKTIAVQENHILMDNTCPVRTER